MEDSMDLHTLLIAIYNPLKHLSNASRNDAHRYQEDFKENFGELKTRMKALGWCPSQEFPPGIDVMGESLTIRELMFILEHTPSIFVKKYTGHTDVYALALQIRRTAVEIIVKIVRELQMISLSFAQSYPARFTKDDLRTHPIETWSSLRVGSFDVGVKITNNRLYFQTSDEKTTLLDSMNQLMYVNEPPTLQHEMVTLLFQKILQPYCVEHEPSISTYRTTP